MRVARLIVPGVAYHLIWRFVDREWFFTCDEERANYLRLLGRALVMGDWQCLAYALMSNHIHLALVAGSDPIESWSKRVNSPFARWMNTQHDRLGPVFADRPKARSVQTGREAGVIAYIHNNPVRAGVVATARASSWTSHMFYSGIAEPPPWLHTTTAVSRTGIGLGDEFDAYVNATPGESGELELRAMRNRARRRGAIEVGTPTETTAPLVRRRHGAVRADPLLLLHVIAEVLGLRVEELCSRQRSERVVAGRWVMSTCATRMGISRTDAAATLGISPSAVTQLLQRAPSPLATAALEVAWERLAIVAPT